jgi:hypothetical protein
MSRYLPTIVPKARFIMEHYPVSEMKYIDLARCIRLHTFCNGRCRLKCHGVKAQQTTMDLIADALQRRSGQFTGRKPGRSFCFRYAQHASKLNITFGDTLWVCFLRRATRK